MKDLRKTVSYLEAEKSELERTGGNRRSASPYHLATYDQPDSGRVSRAQIPLMASAHHHHHHSREGSEGAVRSVHRKEPNTFLHPPLPPPGPPEDHGAGE